MMWVWVNSGSWWWRGRPGVPRFMGSQRDMTEWLIWSDLIWYTVIFWIHRNFSSRINFLKITAIFIKYVQIVLWDDNLLTKISKFNHLYYEPNIVLSILYLLSCLLSYLLLSWVFQMKTWDIENIKH